SVSVKSYRLSGDEFVVLASEPLPVDIENWTSNIHKALSQAPVQVDEHKINLDLSVGIALYPDHGQDAESLLRSSDHAMYEAKLAGRNQVRIRHIRTIAEEKGE